MKKDKKEIEDVILQSGFDKSIRAEKLNVDDWLKLSRNLEEFLKK